MFFVLVAILIASVIIGGYFLKVQRDYEFLLGDVKGWQYEAFDVNVEYSGEMAKVYTTYDWDVPSSFFEH